MKKQRRDQDFLHLPQFPGGKDAFREFIRQNLRYPKEALEMKIQGRVHLAYQVNDKGEVMDVQVTKGIGHGCDEEAVRIIRLMKYDKAKNRGVRVVSTIKTYIEFKLMEAAAGISYTYTTTPPPADKPAPQPEKPSEVYTYIITVTR